MGSTNEGAGYLSIGRPIGHRRLVLIFFFPSISPSILGYRMVGCALVVMGLMMMMMVTAGCTFLHHLFFFPDGPVAVFGGNEFKVASGAGVLASVPSPYEALKKI